MMKTVKLSRKLLSYFILQTSCWFWGLSALSATTPKAQEMELKIGVVQRFGAEATDELTLQATNGDRLSLGFLSGDMQPQTLETDELKLEVAMQPLPVPVVEERLVLSDHGTFETAEDSANQWRLRGIEVEVVQPGRWQVWARRDIYQTPLIRRLLLQSLKAQGEKNAYLDTAIVKEIPRMSFVVNGYRYNRLNLEIDSEKNLIQVSQGKTRKILVCIADVCKSNLTPTVPTP